MGMYFNTPETIEMVARLNTHFSSANGQIAGKRGLKHTFRRGSNCRLGERANFFVIETDRKTDPLRVSQGKWQDWLSYIHTVPCLTLPPVAAPGTTTPIHVPRPSTVGAEVAHLISQGLDDACEEIIFVVVPGASLSVDAPQTIGTATSYALIITVHTKEIAAIRAELKRKALARRRKRLQAAAKKKKP